MRPKTEKKAIRGLVKAILQNADRFQCEVPANGRLTIVLDPGVMVINIFDGRYRQPGTTAIHSHTVDFRSDIVGGVMRQYRYGRVDDGGDAKRYWGQELTLDGKLIGEPAACFLREGELEVYPAGEFYEITADEIHQSVPEDGTVTLITRQHKTRPSSVFTFWPYSAATAGAKTRAIR